MTSNPPSRRPSQLGRQPLQVDHVGLQPVPEAREQVQGETPKRAIRDPQSARSVNACLRSSWPRRRGNGSVMRGNELFHTSKYSARSPPRCSPSSLWCSKPNVGGRTNSCNSPLSRPGLNRSAPSRHLKKASVSASEMAPARRSSRPKPGSGHATSSPHAPCRSACRSFLHMTRAPLRFPQVHSGDGTSECITSTFSWLSPSRTHTDDGGGGSRTVA